MMRLKSKVAIITGAASGNGRGIALRFAEEGAAVVVCDVNESGGAETVDLIHRRGGEALFVRVDVTSANDFQRLVDEVRRRFGRLDILVNNAGISPVGSVTQISEEEWDVCQAIDLKSIFLGCKYAIPLMMEGGGAIVNIAGTLGLLAMPEKAAYCAAKAGVVNLTRQMAIDYGPHNIRVNAICPGFIDTPLTASVSEAERQRVFSRQPIRRAGTVEEIAGAALFLSGEEAGYITGVALPVDGGQILSIPL